MGKRGKHHPLLPEKWGKSCKAWAFPPAPRDMGDSKWTLKVLTASVLVPIFHGVLDVGEPILLPFWVCGGDQFFSSALESNVPLGSSIPESIQPLYKG